VTYRVRVIYRINHSDDTVDVIHVAHRRDA
jgi:hypothetical protein